MYDKHDLEQQGMDAIGLGRYAKAAEFFERAKVLKSQDASIYDNLGFCYLHSKQYDQAIENFKIALAMEPERTKAKINLGHTYNKQKSFQEAQKTLGEIIELENDNIEALVRMGEAYAGLGQEADALTMYEHAIVNGEIATSKYYDSELKEDKHERFVAKAKNHIRTSCVSIAYSNMISHYLDRMEFGNAFNAFLDDMKFIWDSTKRKLNNKQH